MSFKKVFLPALILTAVCLVASLALALTNELTDERIAKVEEERYLASVAAVLSEGATPEKRNASGTEYFVAKDAGDNVVGYAVKTSAKGYGGDVTCVVGFDTDGKIIGLSVAAPDETPGLGSNVTKSKFKNQFLGIDHPPTLNKDDMVTGATYSSRAVEAAVGEAFALFQTITKGE